MIFGSMQLIDHVIGINLKQSFFFFFAKHMFIQDFMYFIYYIYFVYTNIRINFQFVGLVYFAKIRFREKIKSIQDVKFGIFHID